MPEGRGIEHRASKPNVGPLPLPIQNILSIAKEAEGRGDWQLAMAGYKEILPLLYPRLKASQVTHDVVPDGIVERLHEGRMRVLAARSTTPTHTS